MIISDSDKENFNLLVLNGSTGAVLKSIVLDNIPSKKDHFIFHYDP
jgi:hypothetical protein